jgi:formylglycine-generating enzyme required for sulfatase activity
MLFISHSSHDNAQAVRVRDWLRNNGWNDVFLDLDPARGLAPGQRWQDELKRAGERCAAVVVLVSPAWLASRWCQTEFLVADQLGKRIFPVFVAPTSFDDLPLELKAKFQLADISTAEKEADGFERLALGLKRAGLDPDSFEWPPVGEPDRSVYRGLHPLDVQDAAIFFGRDSEITRGLDELRRLRDGAPQRILAILGASGSGKSSFLRAGLIARLRRDEANFLVLPVVRPELAAISGTQGLVASVSAGLGRRVTFESGNDLARALADLRRPVTERLAREAAEGADLPANRPPTIVIPLDQAEELSSAGNAERGAFCDIVADALALDGNALVVATIRSDSYELFQNEPRLARIPRLPFDLPPVPPGAFQQIVEGPAKLSRPPLEIEPALTQKLLSDLTTADALPLLSFTLQRLQARSGRDGKITLADYQNELGGLSGAIQSAVNAALGNRPSKTDLDLARRLFVPALVQVGEDGVKRRVARRSELPEAVQSLAGRFLAHRLLVEDAGKIEVAHESILRQWPGLAGWIAEEEGALKVLDSLRSAASDWCAHSSTKAVRRESVWLIHRGDRLKQGSAVIGRADFASSIDADTKAYVAACLTEEKRGKTRQRWLLVAAGVAAVILQDIAVVVGTLNFGVAKAAYLRATVYRPEVQDSAVLASLPDGALFQDCAKAKNYCPEMVLIPASSDGRAVAKNGEAASIARFAVSKYDVTFANWKACVAANGCKNNLTPGNNGWPGDDRPVINVSWDDAKDYARWLSDITGVEYRLLWNAEWDYVAHAGKATPYPWGEEANGSNMANCYGCESPIRYGGTSTSPVDSFPPNPFGIHDAFGNVYQWVEDCGVPSSGRRLPSGEMPTLDSGGCEQRYRRGGAWNTDASNPLDDYHYNPGTARVSTYGFRVARTL